MRRAAEPDRKQRPAGTRRERRGAGGGGGRCGSGSGGDCGEATQPERRVWCRSSSLRPWVVAADAGRGGNNDSAGAFGRGGEGVCEKGHECLGSGRKIDPALLQPMKCKTCVGGKVLGSWPFRVTLSSSTLVTAGAAVKYRPPSLCVPSGLPQHPGINLSLQGPHCYLIFPIGAQ